MPRSKEQTTLYIERYNRAVSTFIDHGGDLTMAELGALTGMKEYLAQLYISEYLKTKIKVKQYLQVRK